VRSGPGKTAKNKTKKRKRKKKYSGQQQKEIDCDEPHPAPNEKTQPIQWTERPIGALVAANSLWPWVRWGKIKIACLNGSRFIPKWPGQPHLELVHWWLLVHSGPKIGLV